MQKTLNCIRRQSSCLSSGSGDERGPLTVMPTTGGGVELAVGFSMYLSILSAASAVGTGVTLAAAATGLSATFAVAGVPVGVTKT